MTKFSQAAANFDPTDSNINVAKPTLTRRENIEALKTTLPEDHLLYTDQYFINTRDVISHAGINPWVKVQVSIRNGPGKVAGIDEAVAMIEKYCPDLFKHGGKVKALKDGDNFESKEPLLSIEGPLLDFVTVETVVLGAITHGSTKLSDGIEKVDLDKLRERAKTLRAISPNRNLIYMGARHAHWTQDAAISKTCFEEGFNASSTKIGAMTVGKSGTGTTPHIMYAAFAPYVGRESAVVEAMSAYNNALNSKIPRIILPDWNNHEITDTLKVAKLFKEQGSKLDGVRLDTHGGIIGEGALTGPDDIRAKDWPIKLIPLSDPDAKYWYGKGVTVTGCYALQKALADAGYPDVKIVLSSGFADPEKLSAFERAANSIGLRFEVVGCGKLFKCRDAKLELVAAGRDKESIQPLAKSGRGYATLSEIERSEVKLRELE